MMVLNCTDTSDTTSEETPTSETTSDTSDESSSSSSTTSTSETSDTTSEETSGETSDETSGETSEKTSTTSSGSGGPEPDPQPGCEESDGCGCGCGCECGGSSCSPDASEAPVRYFNGEVRMSVTDLSSAGFGLPWGQTRSYTNQLPVDFEYGNGMNWISRERPVLGEADDGTVFVILQFDDIRFFAPAGGNAYTPLFGALETLTYDDEEDTFTFITRRGAQWGFFGLDTPGTPRGQLKSYETPGDGKVDLVYSGQQLLSASRSFESGPSETTTLSYVYQYLGSGLPNEGQISKISLRRQVNSDPPEDIKYVEYSYYDGTTAEGNLGDLKDAWVVRNSDNGWVVEAINYYRYYVDDAGGIGFPHGMRFALGTDAWVRMMFSVGDPETATNSQLAEFADYYFEYDPATRRVTREAVEGGSRSFEFTYTERTSTPLEDFNVWQMKTVETRPSGGGVITVYTNYIGQMLLRELADGGGVWRDYYRYNEDSRLILHAEPSAVVSFDDDDPELDVVLRSGAGLIHLYEYYAADSGTAAKDHLHYEAVQQGTGGTPQRLREYEYGSHTAGGATIRPISKQTVYRDEANTEAIVTTFTNDSYHAGSVQVKQRTTTLPVVPTGQNGSNTAAERWEYFDALGKEIAIKDERGYITLHEYDPATQALVRTVEDADSGLPSGWSALSGPHLNLTTDYAVDEFGRTVEELGPEHEVDGEAVRRATWTVYKDFVLHTGSPAPGAFNEVWSTQGYLEDAAYQVTNPPAPVSITRVDASGRVCLQAVSERDPARTSARLSAGEDYTDQARWARCTVNLYNDQAEHTATRVYHNIPGSGAGTLGTNYHQTDFLHDAMDRPSGERSPGGTITRTVFDARGLPVQRWVGTNDNGFAAPNFNSAGTSDLALVETLAYDGGSDQGDGNLTQQTRHVDTSSGNDRVTAFGYDFRNRQTTIDGPLDFYQRSYYDNLDHVIQVERYDGDALGNLVAKSATAYDDRGRVYQTTRYAVDPSTGTVGHALVDNTWYDAGPNAIKSLPAGSRVFTKTTFDGVGRATATYQGYYTPGGSEPYAEVGQVTSDNAIFEQAFTTYDAAGQATFVASYQRFHDATGNGVLNGPSGAQPKARISYQAMWHDGIGRSVATANYGTNNNAGTPTRPASAPSSSDTVLVMLTGYNVRGEAFSDTNPAGTVTEVTYDDAGQPVQTVQDVGGLGITTVMTYHANGQIATLTATNADTGNQVTTYTYGSTLATSAVASNELLVELKYPEGGSATYTYNRQQERTKLTDPHGTIHEYDYDKLGRETADRATALGTGIDNAVRRIERTYEVRGMLATATSYDAATAGNAVNQVALAYNDFGQLISDAQEHSGAVTGSTPKVQYAYADGSANTIRPTSVTYPNGTVFTWEYAGTVASALSRVDFVNWGGALFRQCWYFYLGLNTFVRTNYIQAGMRWDLITGSGADPYAGLDRFGRVIDCLWYKSSAPTADLARLKYGYNRASSRLWREDDVAATNFDELYTYDAVQRLIDMERGTLTGSPPSGVTSPTLGQDWTLDPTGNWKGFNQTVTGALVQTRTSSKDNQITNITNTVGTTWLTPYYNNAGAMVLMPSAGDVPTPVHSATYDAWNRATRISAGLTSTGHYQYDGLNRRAIKITQVFGNFDTRHYYYSDQWQVLEERVETSTDAERQYVWGIRYVDDLILRERDTDGNGTLDERLHALQDANWNVVAICNASAAVQERYAYTPYGMVQFLDPSFGALSASAFAWSYLFTGRERDVESTMQYNRNRYYHPRLGCWLTRDPMGLEAGDVNPYRYVGNMPPNALDPNGLIEVRVPCPPDAITTATAECADLGGLNPARPPICILDIVSGRTFGRYVKAFCKNTGDCWSTQYRLFRSQVRAYCDAPRSCAGIKCCPPGTTPRSDCNEINRKIFNNNECISARREIMNKCFQGGDPAHRAELQNVITTRNACMTKKAECTC